MPGRSPYDVLSVDVDASAATIKAAWRRLARRHHPDLTGGDAAAARAATRQMAEINAAYEELRDPDRRRVATDRERARARAAGRQPGGPSPRADEPWPNGTGATSAGGLVRAGPPRAHPARPVTGRLDMSDTFAPRNQTLRGNGNYAQPIGPPLPLRVERSLTEPPRASDPTGPLRRAQDRRFQPPPVPELTEAQNVVIKFGKFRGHTLGEVAAFEPSYIDWIATTITRDRELVVAARVVKEDLDERGVMRLRRPPRREPSPLP